MGALAIFDNPLDNIYNSEILKYIGFYLLNNKILYPFNKDFYIEKNIEDIDDKFVIKSFEHKLPTSLSLCYNPLNKTFHSFENDKPINVEHIELIYKNQEKTNFAILYNDNINCKFIYDGEHKYTLVDDTYLKGKDDSFIIYIKNIIFDIPHIYLLTKDDKYYIMILYTRIESTHNIFDKEKEYGTDFEIFEINYNCLHILTNNPQYKMLYSFYRENTYNRINSYSPFKLYYKNEDYTENLFRKYYLPKFEKKPFECKGDAFIKEKYKINVDGYLLNFIIKINKLDIKYDPISELPSEDNQIINDEIINIYNKFVSTYKRYNKDDLSFIDNSKSILKDNKLNEYLNCYLSSLLQNYYFNYSTKHYQNYIFENRDLIYNIIITKLLIKFNDILDDGNIDDIMTFFRENLSNEFMDLNFDKERYFGQILLEIFSGLLFRKKQYEIVDKIINNINEPDNLYDVNQLIMGMGKTAVITPSLIFHFTYCTKYQHDIEKIMLILPETLIKQTNKLFEMFTMLDINKKLVVMSDTDIKTKLLENYTCLNDTNYLMIIDEFDSIYNPMTSNLNIPYIKKKINDTKFSLLSKYIDKYVDIILDEIKNKNYDISVKLNFNLKTDDDTEQILIDTINKCCSMKYNLNYGLKKRTYSNKKLKTDNLHFFKAVPYSAVDTPVEQSDYSEIQYLFVLTIMALSYTEFRDVDYNEIMTLVSKELDSYSLFDEPRDVEQIQLLGIHNLKEFKKNNKISSVVKTIINKNKYFFKKYLIKKKVIYLEFTLKQKNISFMDVISYQNVKKIGFSGTTNLTLPNYTNFKPIDYKPYQKLCQSGGNIPYKNVFDTINNDIEAQGAIYHAIMSSNTDIPIKITKDDPLKQIGDIIFETKYNCLIDTAGLLFIYNSNQIINYLIDRLTTKFERYIYIDNEDNKKIKNGSTKEETDYNGEILTMKDFVLYDNKHIIGQDIKQSYEMMGLCTVDEKTKLTLLAQGIYRLRKMNYGHSINFIIAHDFNVSTKYDILKKTYTCEEAMKYTGYEFTKLMQNYKTLYRNNKNNNTEIKMFEENVYNIFNIEQQKEEEFIENNLNVFNSFEVIGAISENMETIKKYIIKLKHTFNTPVVELAREEEQEEQEEQETQQEQELEIELSLNQNKIKPSKLITVKPMITKIIELFSDDIFDKLNYETGDYTKYFKEKKIIVLNEQYIFNEMYYIYIKTKKKNYFVILSSSLTNNIKELATEMTDCSFIIKKDVDTIIYKQQIDNVDVADLDLEAFINYMITDKINIITIIRACVYFYNFEGNKLYETLNELLYVMPEPLMDDIIINMELRDLNSYDKASTLFSYLYNIKLDKRINIKSHKKICELKFAVDYFKKNINPEFVNDIFFGIDGEKYFKKYLKYKTKYLMLKKRQ